MSHKVLVLGAALLYSTSFFTVHCQQAQTDSVKLGEVVVRGYGAERNLKSPEMGRTTLDNKAITNLPVMFGEPDVVKTLQTLPGVSQGVEGFTGLFVRGGDNDQNLFLYQGLPLYHVSHLGGIFSSFYVVTVSHLDFYKAAFPAQYGGRISSITDITTKRPDFHKFHGRFSLGLLSANAYLSGPIVKDKTAFSMGVRRSWIDVVSVPTLAIMNAIDKKKGKKHMASYNFMDFNARIDHKFTPNLSAYAIGYYGHDYMNIGQREFEPSNSTSDNDDSKQTHFFDKNSNRLSWGNWGALASLSYRFVHGIWNTEAYYSNYASTYHQDHIFQTDESDPATYGYSKSRTRNSIADAGVRTSYFGDFSRIYQLRVGMVYVNHRYLPEGLRNHLLDKGSESSDDNGSRHISANEMATYVDNTLNIADIVALSVGLRGTAYHIQDHWFSGLEPRASVKVAAGQNMSIKASYARMSQYAQQISSNYINLPTDLWQPITPKFKPLRSDQYSLGVYGNLPLVMYFSVEGWYKNMTNLLEYREGVAVLNSGLAWHEKLTAGKVWDYGADLSVTKDIGKITGTVGYGLMWNWRKFSELNHGHKFPAKFDNRHKVNVNVAYKLNDHIDLNAGWTYMTGNRLTLSLYNYDMPGESLFPDAPSVGYPDDNESDGINYYSSRNNVRIPAFHRLDIGVNSHKNLKKGRKGIWSFGLYNAYCRMNAITIKKESKISYDMRHWQRAFKTLSFIPVIPSVSYTYML